MKKIIIIINLVMIFGLIGCGNNSKESVNNSRESVNNQPIAESTDTNNKLNTTKERCHELIDKYMK